MHSAALLTDFAEAQLVTMRIHNQCLGMPVQDVREILQGQRITQIPLVPEEIAGVLNLRGRIVTVIDIRHRLQLPPRPEGAPGIFVVVEHKGELYSLIVDSVGEVLNIPAASIQGPPPNLSPNWRDISAGVYQRQQDLMVILDPKPLFRFG